MDKLIICIMLLCSTGYIINVCSDVMNEYEYDEIYLDSYNSIYKEDKSRPFTLSNKEEDISNHQGSKSIMNAYNQIINRKSDKYRIEQSLIKAVIKVESNWNSKAISSAGAMGLMQLMPTTAKDMNIRNPFNPEDNIDGGARYLRYLLDKFDGNLTHALAAYNAGPTRVERHRGIPPIQETRQYVKRVLALYNDDKSNYTAQTLKSKI